MGVTANEMPDVPLVGLRIAVSEQGTTSTIVVEGEWDLAGQQAAREAVGEALRRRPECLVLDLSRLAFIDPRAFHRDVDCPARGGQAFAEDRPAPNRCSGSSRSAG